MVEVQNMWTCVTLSRLVFLCTHSSVCLCLGVCVSVCVSVRALFVYWYSTGLLVSCLGLCFCVGVNMSSCVHPRVRERQCVCVSVSEGFICYL